MPERKECYNVRSHARRCINCSDCASKFRVHVLDSGLSAVQARYRAVVPNDLAGMVAKQTPTECEGLRIGSGYATGMTIKTCHALPLHSVEQPTQGAASQGAGVEGALKVPWFSARRASTKAGCSPGRCACGPTIRGHVEVVLVAAAHSRRRKAAARCIASRACASGRL